MSVETTTLAFLNARTQESLDLLKDRILIGRSDKCDIVINDPSLSEYHSLLTIDKNGSATIMDLNSHNGTFVNGLRIAANQFISIGDKVKFGNVLIEVIETFVQEQVFQQDEVVINKVQEEAVYIPERHSENEILIDDEYCDIVFDENHFKPIYESPLKAFKLDEYIESDELEAPYDIKEDSASDCILISTLVSGTILDQVYLPLKDGEYMAHRHKQGGKNILIDILASESTPFISVTNGQIKVNALEGFEFNKLELNFSDNDTVIVLTAGTFQIFIEMSKAPNNLIRLPLLTRDKEFFKQTTKIFASVMLPMLLLLLVDFEKDEKKDLKKLSVIYKRATNTKINGKTHASKNPTNTNKNDGHKKTEQNEKKVARSKQGEKTKANKPQKKVAKTNVKKANNVKKAKAPVKAYQFKMAANVNSMFSDGKTATVAASRNPASVANSNSLTGSLDTKVNGTTSKAVGNLGSDLSGTANSFGAKGLSGKKGMDTSYIQTETVVLGSMDPELLRKILQQYLPQFRHCYQQELVYNSEDIRGIVDLNFEILGSGKVSKVDIKAKDNRFSKKGIDCMAKVLGIIDFPKPKGGGRVAVRQPLNFFSEKSSS
tara:strand:- start:174873 stop:176681 length:1809 start_codon:yes stop_codon:yes gene_type:complete